MAYFYQLCFKCQWWQHGCQKVRGVIYKFIYI
jgi:hypothetical protein